MEIMNAYESKCVFRHETCAKLKKNKTFIICNDGLPAFIGIADINQVCKS